MRPHPRTWDRRFYGVVEAIVDDIVDPDKEGRIKVRFPWYDDGTITEWCRVRQLYAGKGYGTFFIPEVDDEVLVAFVHGDMTLPIILGGLYNGKDTPPSDRQKDDDKNEKLIKTKAGHLLLFDDTTDKEKIKLVTKRGHTLELHDKDKDGNRFVELHSTKGHVLRFDDKDDEEKIQITSKDGHEVTLDDHGKKLELTSKGGHTIQLDDDGKTITVKTSGGQSLVMDANGKSVTIKADTITFEAQQSLSLKAQTVTVDASSIEIGKSPTDRVVLGDELMDLFNQHTHPVGPITSGPPIERMDEGQLSDVARVK